MEIGAIYGDAITLDRQIEMYKRLSEKGFASTNIVIGVGSFTYQMNSRDSLGFAAKGAWFEADGVAYDIYKEPVTDDGTKKSLKGMIRVNNDFSVSEQCSFEEENSGLLQTIFLNGELHNRTTLAEIRKRLSENN